MNENLTETREMVMVYQNTIYRDWEWENYVEWVRAYNPKARLPKWRATHVFVQQWEECVNRWGDKTKVPLRDYQLIPIEG